MCHDYPVVKGGALGYFLSIPKLASFCSPLPQVSFPVSWAYTLPLDFQLLVTHVEDG